jgi:hypothetical protein
MKIMRSTRLKQFNKNLRNAGSAEPHSTIMNTIPPSNYKLVIKEDSFSDYNYDDKYISFGFDELYIHKYNIDLSDKEKNVKQIELFNQKFDISYYTPTKEDMNIPGNFYQYHYVYKITKDESFESFIKNTNSKQVEYEEQPFQGNIYISKKQDLSSLLVRI